MKKLTIRETRQGLSRLEKILAQEGEVTITRRGEAIARVVPIGKQKPIPLTMTSGRRCGICAKTVQF